MRKTGDYKKIGATNYFIPAPLPPSDPDLKITPELLSIHGQALFELGKLNEVADRLPNKERFVKAYIIKEAMLSSAIEGIHTTLIDVLTSPLEGIKPNKQTQLVLNYMSALEAGIGMMTNEQMPLCVRLLKNIHEILMSDGEGERSLPGQFRTQSVRVGNLVPPPAPDVPELMHQLEQYIHRDDTLSPLIRNGLVHVQFETIHPFADGNGRIGRLLIVLMAIHDNLLSVPILYPSYYFKKHHMSYYHHLDRVRTHGDFEGWLLFYLHAIANSAHDAYVRCAAIESLDHRLQEHIQHSAAFTKVRETALESLTCLFAQPIINVTQLSEQLDMAYNTAHNILQVFAQEGIVSVHSVGKRSKVYHFDQYLELLEIEQE